MIELPHIPKFLEQSFYGANMTLLSFLCLLLWECEVCRDAAQQPGASLVPPPCCST